jgi:hypothetical protein
LAVEQSIVPAGGFFEADYAKRFASEGGKSPAAVFCADSINRNIILIQDTLGIKRPVSKAWANQFFALLKNQILARSASK